MKKRWIGVFLVTLATVLLLTACSTGITNGTIDGIDQLPCTVEVTGLEGVTGTANVKLVDSATKESVLSAVKDVYYVEDGAVTYAVDISITNDGKEVEVGKPVTVSIKLNAPALPLDSYVVFHVHNGVAEKIVPTVDGDKLTFTVESFSSFIVVPKHEHSFGDWTVSVKAAGCGEAGLEKRVCVCGEEEVRDYIQNHELTHHAEQAATCTEDGTRAYESCSACGRKFTDATCGEELDAAALVIPARGHIDENGDGYCDRCKAKMEEENPQTESVCTVEAMGGDGSVLTADVQSLSETDKAAALRMVRDAYYLEEDAVTYAVDISVKNAKAGMVVRVSLGIKNPALPLDQYVIYHIHDGAVEKIEPTVSEEKLVFMVKSFSPFIIGPKHLHQPSPLIEQTPVSCETDGVSYVECIKCHEKLEIKTTPALGHIDENKDGLCDRCGKDMKAVHTGMDGKVYVFDHVTGEGISQTAFNEAYEGAALSFFENNCAEYHTYKAVRGTSTMTYEVVLSGCYTIEDGVITLSTVNRYVNGEQFNGILPTVTFAYDKVKDEISVVVDDGMGHEGTCCFVYDSKITAVPYTPPALADNWDAAKIEAAFKAVGADKDYVLPKLNYVNEMTVSEPVDGVITITCRMSSQSSGYDTASAYVNALKSAFYAYKFNETVDGYLTANSECFFTAKTQYEGQIPVMILTVRQFAPAYPALAITEYLETNGVTDEIISFVNEWAVAYNFTSGKTTQLVLNLRTDADYAGVAATLRDRLKTEKGYEEITTPDGTVYLYSQNKQIVFKIVSGKSPAVEVVFLDESALPILKYPSDAIAAWLTGTTDGFVEVSDELVTEYKLYYEHNNDYRADVLRVVGMLPKEVDGEPIANAFAEKFAGAGYKYTSFFIRLDEADAPTPVFAWVSANREIAVLLSGFSAEYLEKTGYGGDFAYYNVSIINLTTVETSKKSFLTALLVDHQLGQDVYDKGNEFTFRGNIALGYRNAADIGTAYYTFNSALSWYFTESLDNYFDFDLSAVNMNAGGEYTVGVSFKANTDIKGTFNIKVFAMTSITVEYSDVKKDGRPYYIGMAIQYTSEATFKGKYTVTRHFSDGTSDTVAGTECDFSKDDVDINVGIQTLTISHTYKGVTCTCDVEIGVYRGYNFSDNTSWDVTADNATFAIYAIGGSYGTGTWTAVVRTERGDFHEDLFADMTEFYMVRINPAYDVFGETVYNLDSEDVVWNKSAVISASQTSGTFTFLD